MMKKHFTLMTLFLAMFVSSCYYDDTALVNDMNGLREEIENLKDRVDDQQVLLNALANQLTIVSIEETSEGYVITFSDNSTLTINHGKDGANGKDGKDGVDGKDGAIVDVVWDDDSATFTLADGTTLVIPLDITDTPEEPEEPEEPETPVIPDTPTVDIEAVDLGLSVKWASCNVGATLPEEYGDYFAWGEVNPKSGYWDTNCLTYAKAMSNISSNIEYDAATANWGNSWRMPTREEMDELVNNCTWSWSKLNGVNGMVVKGSTGNSIFLPAAGRCYRSSSDYVNSVGYYWSSTPPVLNDFDAYRLYFGAGNYDWGWDHDDRYYGLPVRPVQNK